MGIRGTEEKRTLSLGDGVSRHHICEYISEFAIGFEKDAEIIIISGTSNCYMLITVPMHNGKKNSCPLQVIFLIITL
jgi:ribulose kinase